jgi:hypothetical protein
MIGRCSCFLLDDGKICLVQVEDWKMFLFLLDNGKVLLIHLEDVKLFPILQEEGTMHLSFLMGGKRRYLASTGGTEGVPAKKSETADVFSLVNIAPDSPRPGGKSLFSVPAPGNK